MAVHASNATLPQTVTQEQIDNALSNSCAAWGDVASDGTLSSGLNVNQPNKTGTGQYEYTFINPMPSADYAVTATPVSNGNRIAMVTAKTVTGFTIRTKDKRERPRF